MNFSPSVICRTPPRLCLLAPILSKRFHCSCSECYPRTLIRTLQSETSMRATEAEIVADCCKELEEEAAKASGKTKGPVAASATTKPSAVAVAAAAATSKTTVERFFEDDRLPNAV
uniref:Protein SMG9 n=1 Tax=Mesocestoides corti TaxID=53468 RepID=A0A5K3FZ37_MESCO